MGTEISILTPEQEKFLDLAGRDKSLVENVYFTGGTPLSAFYLNHRLSEDIDFFSEEEINLLPVRAFIGKVQKELKLKKVDYRQYLGLHTFQLYFSDENILKVDFCYYPFSRIEQGIVYKNIKVDSVLDIAVNKVHTIAMNPRARDFIDIYFIIKERNCNFKDLLLKAKIKFDWHIDAIQLGSRLLLAKKIKDYPRMIKEINHNEWKNFFIDEAKKLKDDILC